MADSSILELAAEAASSTLFIFCFFNFIILIILFSSFHQQNDDDYDVPLSIVIHSNTNTQQDFMLQKNELTETLNEPDRCMNFNCSDKVEESDHDHEDEEEDEEDFRRRVEEFIEKVNRGWRQESQTTSRSMG